MNAQLLQQLIDTFGTQPLAGSQNTFAKVLLLPDDTIAVYYVNAEHISPGLQSRGYTWNTHLHVWEKHVTTIAAAKSETEGFPATAAALSQIQ